MTWKDRFEIVDKFDGREGCFWIIVDKQKPGWSMNMKKYREKRFAQSACVQMFNAEQKKIEKALLE